MFAFDKLLRSISLKLSIIVFAIVLETLMARLDEV